MSDMPSEEIIVYGDAPEGGGESTTDVLSLPADFYTFYVPAGPTIINPPPGGGGGGGDVGNPKEEFEDGATKATWIAAGFTVMALIPGVGQAVVIGGGVMAVAFGLGAYHLGQAAGDPPQPNFRRPAGSNLPVRNVRPTDNRTADQIVKRVVSAERTTATFVDAAECLQGAIMAGDADWAQQHALAARGSYAAAGGALANLADALPAALEPMRGHPKAGAAAPADIAKGLDKMITDATATLDLTAEDRTKVMSVLRPAVGRGIPTSAELTDAVTSLARVGKLLLAPLIAPTRFAFVHTRPS